MFLAGFKFMRNAIETEDGIIDIKCNKLAMSGENYNYEKYNFGKISMYFLQ